MASIGIVGGGGKLPIIFSDSARQKGDKVVGIGLRGLTDPALEAHVDKFIWIDPGAIQKTILSVVAERINKIALLGKIDKGLFLRDDTSLDADVRVFAGKALGDMKDYSMLNKAASFLSKFGIEIIDPTPYISFLIPQKGALTARKTDPEEAEDINYGFRIAKDLARFDIGQAVALKKKTVLALEAAEGTDDVITRAGKISKKGFVLVKVARPDQDMRFDVPSVGLETVHLLAKAGGTALALESGRTFLLDRDEVIKFANEKNIAIEVI
ncbi:MAG: UDP-2,3-diacylglucosamine diphosphatase LpxI [Candidatus Omnitrophica bacterium]|nr:UDP-2,3-diacylglucosamine diphosphatase LpxI [Candidatus Omnitrophota bacterium]